MNVSKLSLIGLVVAVLGVSVYWLFFKQGEVTVFEREDELSEAPLEETSLPPNASEAPATSTFLEILPADCQNECISFQTVPDQYVYCQNVCGLSADPATPTPKPTDPNLSQNIERKNAAIKESNLSKCGEITDANLRKACEVRVTEDLLE